MEGNTHDKRGNQLAGGLNSLKLTVPLLDVSGLKDTSISRFSASFFTLARFTAGEGPEEVTWMNWWFTRFERRVNLNMDKIGKTK